MVVWSVRSDLVVVDATASFCSSCIVLFVHSLHLSYVCRLRHNSYTVFRRLVRPVLPVIIVSFFSCLLFFFSSFRSSFLKAQDK